MCAQLIVLKILLHEFDKICMRLISLRREDEKIFLHGFDKIFVNEYHTFKQRSSRLINEHMDLVNWSKRLWSEILFALILIKQGLNKAVNFTCKSKKLLNMRINISWFSYQLTFTSSDLHKSTSIFWRFSLFTVVHISSRLLQHYLYHYEYSVSSLFTRILVLFFKIEKIFCS